MIALIAAEGPTLAALEGKCQTAVPHDKTAYNWVQNAL